MTQQLEQKEAIEVLGNIKILPEDYNFKVVNCNRDRVVCRTYYIDKNSTKYPFLNRIVVEYKMNISTERITDYSVYLTNDSGDILYLCKYTPDVLNTLFTNIISLELSNWRRIVNNQLPLKNINDYKSLLFEFGSNKRDNNTLRKMIEKNINTSKILNKFHMYINTNGIVPTEIWKHQLFS